MDLHERVAKVTARGILIDTTEIDDLFFPRAIWKEFECRCDVCRKPHLMWFTTNKKWKQLPAWAQHIGLCQACFLNFSGFVDREESEAGAALALLGLKARFNKLINRLRRDLPEGHPDKLYTPMERMLRGEIRTVTGRFRSPPQLQELPRRPSSDRTGDWSSPSLPASEPSPGLQPSEPREPSTPSKRHRG